MLDRWEQILNSPHPPNFSCRSPATNRTKMCSVTSYLSMWLTGNIIIIRPFLCALAELREATISFAMRLSARNSSAGSERIFTELDIWVFFKNLSRKSKFHANVPRITGTKIHFSSYIAQLFLKWEMFQIKSGRGEHVKTQLNLTKFIVMTTCFGRCGPSSGHKITVKY